MIHGFGHIRFFFGDASTPVDGKALVESYDQALQSRNQIQSLASKLGVSDLFFLHQIHANHGAIIEEKDRNLFQSFSVTGDYLITQCKSIAIGVLTADCVPVLIHDPIQSAIAAVHAGWKGAVNNVVANACRHMHESFGSKYKDMRMWIGPCARICCYEVSPEFIKTIPDMYVGNIIKRNDQFFFDLLGCVEHQLLDLGIRQSFIDTESAACTLHNNKYCSSRRSGRSFFRQISAIGIILK